MAFDFDFDKIKEEVFTATRSAGDKFNDVSAQAKKRIEIRSKEDFIQAKYAELGKAYYEAHKDDEIPGPAQEIIDAIRTAQSDIDALNDELLGMQGSVVCPKCGMKQNRNHIFCSNCGNALQ